MRACNYEHVLANMRMAILTFMRGWGKSRDASQFCRACPMGEKMGTPNETFPYAGPFPFARTVMIGAQLYFSSPSTCALQNCGQG